MESWLVTLGWIEFIVALVILIFIAFISYIIVKHRNIEFNKYWKSRLLICASAFVWIIALLLGNDFLWRPGQGLFGSSENYYKYICHIHVFFTVGSAEPLFFVVFLFIIKSKTSSRRKNNSSTLYREDPNYYIFKWSIIFTIPIVVIHIIILILDSSNISEPKKLFWTTYDPDTGKCAVPIISTAAFAIFFVIFLFFFFLISNRFSKTVLNRTLINRIRLSIGCFILFLPLEVAIRVVLIFTLKIGNTSLALFHAFFFVDVIVAVIAMSEFAFFPVLDSIGYRVSFGDWKMTKTSLRRLFKGEEQDGRRIGQQIDEKDVISVHTNQDNSESNIMTPLADKSPLSTQQKQLIKQKFNAGGGLSIDDDDDDEIMGGNIGGAGGASGGDHIIEMDRLSPPLVKPSPKGPAFDRVLNTNDINRPVSPLSTPLSSSSKSSTPSSSPSAFSLLNNNNNNTTTTTQTSSTPSGYQAPAAGGHERKKSRRLSLAFKKKSPTSTPPTQSPPLSSSPLSTSPTNNSNVSSMFKPTPVDDFRNQLMKYSNNKRF